MAGRRTVKSCGSGAPMQALTQLAQLGGSFCDFAQARVSLIKGLGGAKERFERVVPTLGIFFRCRGGLMAHVPSPHDSQERWKGSLLLAPGAQRACRGACHPTNGSASW